MNPDPWSGSASDSPSPQGMKVSCTHFQCAAGAFSYLREHFPQAYSVDMSRQILTLNVNLMLVRSRPCWGWTVAHRSGRDKPGPGLQPSEPQVGQELLGGEAGRRGVCAVCPGEEGGPLHPPFQGQAQECLLEKSMLDNRKSFLVARISAQVGPGDRGPLGTGAGPGLLPVPDLEPIPAPRWWITTKRPAAPWRTPTLLCCWAGSRRTGRSWSR